MVKKGLGFGGDDSGLDWTLKMGRGEGEKEKGKGERGKGKKKGGGYVPCGNGPGWN